LVLFPSKDIYCFLPPCTDQFEGPFNVLSTDYQG
jgi:hypothetical protein